MKLSALLAMVCAAWVCAAGTRGQTIEDMPPVVVQTVPQAGTTDVPSGESVIKVTFSKDMADGSWSWSSAWKDSTSKFLGQPKYEADHRTCTVRVQLEPGKTYGFWLNSERFHGFQDKAHHPAVPYLLTFQASRAPAAASGASAPTSNALKGKLINWVENFFSQNYRDITARKTLEWGSPQTTPQGNLAIRYKFLATIWNKDRLIIEQRFTFTREGKFISAETLDKHPAVGNHPATQPATPE